jgi:hypothetical protein
VAHPPTLQILSDRLHLIDYSRQILVLLLNYANGVEVNVFLEPDGPVSPEPVGSDLFLQRDRIRIQAGSELFNQRG